VALQSFSNPGRLTYRRFLELFRHMVGLLGRVISPSQGFYLNKTTQHRKMRTNIQALRGIQTHDPSNQPAKTHAWVTVTGNNNNSNENTNFISYDKQRLCLDTLRVTTWSIYFSIGYICSLSVDFNYIILLTSVYLIKKSRIYQ
jgi:hypothetical protein